MVRCALGLLLAALPAAAQTGYKLVQLGNPDVVNTDLGARVAIIGDLDGDGVADVAIGDPAAKVLTAFGAGEVRLVSGATGAVIRTHLGTGSEALGSAVARVGDVDLDGIPDYVAGAPNAPPGGKAYVWSGATGALVRVISGIAVPIFIPFPGSVSERLGWAVAGPGDLTGDGTPDLVIGSPWFAAMGGIATTAGRFQVFDGATGASVFAVAGTFTQTLLGAAVAGVGDLNNDGVNDYVVGAPRVMAPAFLPPTVPPGYVTAYAGGTNAVVLWSAAGTVNGDAFGLAIAPAGDVNADGVPDVIVGAPATVVAGTPNYGSAVVLSGASGAVLFSVPGLAAGELLGAAVSRAGDVDGDGTGDVLVGSPGGAGKVQLVYGPTGTVSSTVAVGLTGDALGSGIAGGALLNAGPIPDAVIGATQSAAPGYVTVIELTGGTVLYQVPGTPSPIPFWIVASCMAGDQDGDAVQDVALFLATGSILLVSGATSQVIRTLPGPVPSGTPRCVLAAVGDANGDGYGDFAAATLIASDTAQLLVLSGRTGAILSNSVRNVCGLGLLSIATPGDYDADGILEIALGCYVVPVSCGSPQPGFVEIRSGASGALLGQINGFAVWDGFGAAVGAAGDVTGDGVPDLVVGASSASAGPLASAGAVYVYSAAAAGPPYLSLFGVSADEKLGMSVAGVGDVDGDGYDDVAASNYPGLAPPTTSIVKVFAGAGGGQLATLASGQSNDGFGRPLTGAGDLDGDGAPDVAVGAFSMAGGPQGAGRLLAFRATGGAPIFTLAGTVQSEGFADQISPAGDWNQDGLDELLVSSDGPLYRTAIVSFAGIPKGSHAFGSPCPVPGGHAPWLSAFGGELTASTGNPAFGLVVSKGPPIAPGVLMIGASSTSYLGAPLPANLSSVGLPGCSLYVSLDLLFPFALSTGSSGLGSARLGFPLPAIPGIAGTTVHCQAYVSASASAAFPGGLTRALTLVVQ